MAVFAGGDRVAPDAVADLGPEVVVVAADSGVDHALALGRRIDLAVGDFDSLSPAGRAALEAAGVPCEGHPAAKDRSDLELALDRARSLGADRIVVVGGHGGRVDHFLVNAALLSSPALAGIVVEARFGAARVHVVRRQIELSGVPGDLVTLLAVDRPADEVSTEGLLYPLRRETLHPGSSRGLSNELVARVARVTVGDGSLLVVQPGEQGTHLARRAPAAPGATARTWFGSDPDRRR